MPYDGNGNWSNTGSETLNVQQAMNKSLGYGLTPEFLAAGDSTTTDEVFFVIAVINEAVISAITVANSIGGDELKTITLSVGTAIYGEISNVTCTSGVLACYK